jgi:hypothetical protein
MGDPARQETGLSPWVAAAADGAVLVVFVAIGRRTHHEDAGAVGFFRVLWPFAAGLVVGWAVAGLVRSPLSARRAAVAWLVTIAVGMALRIVAQDREFKLSFVVVALLFVGAGMLGWRGALRLVRGRPSRAARR